MHAPDVMVIGGGAAGFFAAITCAQANPTARVTVLEKGPKFLAKVRISGGGRCNVTHACFEPREFATRYPRGGQALIGPFQRFQAADTVNWFAARGVQLKVEEDGRMFPVSDSSETIIHCLTNEAAEAGVSLRANAGVTAALRRPGGGFELRLENGEALGCDRLLLATGGCRTPALASLAVGLGHSIVPPVPSLFTFHVACPWLQSLSGVSMPDAEILLPAQKLRERGPVLITHWGLSGPVVLRLSAWGARALSTADYNFPIVINWLPHLDEPALAAALQERRQTDGARLILNAPLSTIPSRLWEQLVLAAGLPRETRWATLPRPALQALTRQLQRTELAVTGKSLNKDEFVTCGGVKLGEVNFKTMESRICPGLHFAGELLDLDGITGGFNFQAAWTTGWLAGQAMAQSATT